jgi:gamma-glutamylcyclotransferase (GGCT)/AIG2-like uncharacterized protein YtfP
MATRNNNTDGDALALVFVYGTLMAGEGNHRLLAGHGAAFMGPAITEPAFTLIDLGSFPAAVADGDTAIRGEVYLVDPPTLAALDRLEGHPSFYRRTPITLADGREVETYVLPADGASWRPARTPIASGDWRQRAA